MKLFAPLCFTIMSMFSGTCYAQSAEETALFLVNGMHEGKVWDEEKNIKFVITSQKPFTIEAKSKITQKYTVTRITDCIYKVEGQSLKPDGSLLAYGTSLKTIDFSKATALNAKLDGDKINYRLGEIDGICVEDRPLNEKWECTYSVYAKYATPQLRSRLTSALNHMKENFCKGRAF